MVRGVVPTRAATSPMRSSSVGVPVAVMAQTTLIDLHVSFEEVLEQPLPVGGEHRLGMELDAFGGELAVADAQGPAAAGGRGLESLRQRVGVDAERVVAAGFQRRRD